MADRSDVRFAATPLIERLERCVAADSLYVSGVTITPHEARLLCSLWVAANETVAFHAPKVKPDGEVSGPHKRLRDAVRGIA